MWVRRNESTHAAQHPVKEQESSVLALDRSPSGAVGRLIQANSDETTNRDGQPGKHNPNPDDRDNSKNDNQRYEGEKNSRYFRR